MEMDRVATLRRAALLLCVVRNSIGGAAKTTQNEAIGVIERLIAEMESARGDDEDTDTDDGPGEHDCDDCDCCEEEGPEPPRPIDLPYAIRHIFLAMPPGGEVIIRRDREG